MDHRVIDEHINFADILRDFLESRFHCLFVAEIQLITVSFSTFFMDITKSLSQCVWVDFNQRNGCAICTRSQGHLASNATSSTSDDDFLASNITHVLSSYLRLAYNATTKSISTKIFAKSDPTVVRTGNGAEKNSW